MRGAPHDAGPQTVSVQFTGGGEVGGVRSDTSVRLDEVGQLPVVLGPVEAGRMLGLGRTTTYRLLRQGSFPVPAHRAGRTWRIPTAGILAHLGLEAFATSGGCSRCGARSDHGMEGES
ncbi:helix-turn-helix domain-containing protein [Nocardiopsis sp. MG754419]|uniref:helix-turn-helix domain-containing protein n=1 Tax=Nocardiopsis sp. MG754419 TaxID=2259865 RepID=UPI001BA9B5F8|nr:helix-turn-helix domain-containing protein [Nocardiopsis sp. MG754419]MBR8743714.1 DNA-binding protein [Nocardiopsis sp. MG754419]